MYHINFQYPHTKIQHPNFSPREIHTPFFAYRNLVSSSTGINVNLLPTPNSSIVYGYNFVLRAVPSVPCNHCK